MIGETGRAITDIEKSGTVQVHGEYWQARSDKPIAKGAEIAVLAVDRMTLLVAQK